MGHHLHYTQQEHTASASISWCICSREYDSKYSRSTRSTAPACGGMLLHPGSDCGRASESRASCPSAASISRSCAFSAQRRSCSLCSRKIIHRQWCFLIAGFACLAGQAAVPWERSTLAFVIALSVFVKQQRIVLDDRLQVCIVLPGGIGGAGVCQGWSWVGAGGHHGSDVIDHPNGIVFVTGRLCDGVQACTLHCVPGSIH